MILIPKGVMPEREYSSPVEFILVATVGGHQRVVAKSRDAQIDLISYSARMPASRYPRRRSFFANAFYPQVDDLRPHAVASAPFEKRRSDEIDRRDSDFTFVWRGINNKQVAENVAEILSDLAPIMSEALYSEEDDDVGFLLSHVVARCNEAIIDEREQRVSKAVAWRSMTAIFGIYFVIAVAAAFFLIK